ncbi:uncharacterized protein [Rutidosis leptorrhynchoides]|uniref:uncharacterized protein n=1 Tax=Rutidosis leptorrhynchoides TaxID=125765 RepID=UPI003A999CD0
MLYNEEECSGNDSDTGFEEDMEALRRACSLTGINEPVDDLPTSSTVDGDYEVTDESEDEDLELLRSIQQRFSVPTDDIVTEQKPITMKPLNTILASGLSDDSGDDYETLCAIQRRFSQYNDDFDNCTESSIQRSEQVGATHNIDLGKESSPNIFVKRVNNGQGFLDSVDGRGSNQNSDNVTPNANAGHEPGSELVSTTDGGFPRSAQAFVEAINKNRTCQKFIRNKLIQIEAKLEENRKLKERVKILKDFQVACRKRTGRALSQKKDARIQLISVPKQRANASKLKDKSSLPMLQGPAENSQVANYRDAMSRYPFSLNRDPWSKEEKKNLMKGIKQQFQEVLMQNLFSAGDADSSYLDRMMKQIRDHILTPEEIKLFLPEVNWEHLASMYVTGRSGPECQSRWINCEDPSINQQPWNIQEDKKLQCMVQKQGLSNWIKVAKELNTNRTPFQCLARFQRSLNVSIIKNEWTRSEDEELRCAVAEYGDTNWQLVASTLEGRTGTQCSNRWKKTLNPLRKRVGKWDKDEDKRLKIAVRLFGAKNWNKIANFVPGRTQVQCRERWVNCLDPSLNMNEWTEEEDLKLKQAIEDHGYSWSRVAACIPPRTDSQCYRRWRVLFPHEVPMLQAARQLKKAMTLSNFVDRESERPDITVNDFITSPLLIESSTKVNEDNKISKNKKSRGGAKKRSRGAKKVAHTDKVFRLRDEDDVDDNNGHADVTAHGEGPTGSDEVTCINKEKPTRERRSVVKIRSRRARQVTRTQKALGLIEDENELGGNDDRAEITSHDRSRAVDGCNSEVIEKATRKRKRRSKKGGDKKDEALETDAILTNKTTIDEFSAAQDDAEPALHVINALIVYNEDGPISTNERSTVDPINECCSSMAKIDSTVEDEAHKKVMLTYKRRIKKRKESVELEKSRIEFSDQEMSGYCEIIQEEDEYDETLASFLSKVKRRRLEHR